MARARQAIARPATAAPRSAAERGLHVSQAATDLAQLLRARSFCLAGSGALFARIAANLQATGGSVDEEAAAWIGQGTPPAGRIALSLGAAAGALGPHSFGFLNNLDGIAPLAAPLGERPRRGSIAWVVPRRDALPEVLPLLCGRGLGVSWLISVGDGDPADVLRFLGLDPATSGILLALGRGTRAQSLLQSLGDKPVVLLEPSPLPPKEGSLVRAVARRSGAVIAGSLEEWLAHAALIDSAALPPSEERGKGRSAKSAGRRLRAAVVVAGAGGDFVASEVARLRVPQRAQLSVRTVDSEEPELIAAALAQAASEAQLVVLCGAADLIAEHEAPGSLLRVDSAQPERLRALLQALAVPTQLLGDDKPWKSVVDRGRLEGVLADLPPPLYVGGAAVSDEVLGDHDLKRLLHAYGARVSRQAPANTTTAALRILGKLSLPVELVPVVAPQADVELLLSAESGSRVSCASQAELKRQTALLLSRSPHVLLRETLAPAPKLRLQAGPERSLGGAAVMRLGRLDGDSGRGAASFEAVLLPLKQGEARQLAEQLLSSSIGDAACDAKALCELLAGVAACVGDNALSVDLVVHLAKEPVIAHAAGVLKRRAGRSPERAAN
jgi:hypothetical protein